MESPIVTMITEMIGSPISGRSTTICRSTPKIIMNTKVSSIAQTKGS